MPASGKVEERPLTKKELKAKRKLEKKAKKASKKGVPEISMPVIPKDPLNMEAFFKQMEEVKADLDKIRENCDAIERSHQLILQSVVEAEIKEQEACINAYMNTINQTSVKVRKTLELIDYETKALTPIAPRGSGDLRMRQINHAALIDKLANLMKRLQDIQQGATSKHHSQIERQYKISNTPQPTNQNLVKPEVEKEELEEVVETVGAMTLTTQQIFSLGQSRDPLETLEAMKARRKDVMDIEKNIVVAGYMSIGVYM
jgi:t-SNARE complex subunit (syntaxin)